MTRAQGRVAAIAKVHQVVHGPRGDTAIDKRPVSGPVRVDGGGIIGDRHCSRGHGGPDQAVYVYAAEDAESWEVSLGCELPPGFLGENLRTVGMDVNGALVGEQWQVGPVRSGVLLEVTMPRTSCSNLSAQMDRPQFHRRFARAGPGAMTRVVRPGTIVSGDPIRTVHRPDHGITLVTLRGTPTREQWERLLQSDVVLAATVRRRAQRRLAAS